MKPADIACFKRTAPLCAVLLFKTLDHNQWEFLVI